MSSTTTLLLLAILYCCISHTYAIDCQLVVPPNPLTAAGLATPYVLRGAVRGQNCTMSNTGHQTFVEGVIFVPSTGQLFVYNPVRFHLISFVCIN